MTALAEPTDAPEPGAFASAEVDKLLLSWRAKPVYSALGATPDDVAAVLTAIVVDDLRVTGHDLREGITAVGKRLTELAGIIGRAPFGEDEIANFVAAFPETEEPTPSV